MSSPEKFYIFDTATGQMTLAGDEAPAKVADGKVLVGCHEPVRGVLARHEAMIASLQARLDAAEAKLAKAGL